MAGAVMGWIISSKPKRRYQFCWGTFRTNVVSSVTISIGHSILLFQAYIPFSEAYFKIAVYRFINGFCGTSSSFAGVIHDTVMIYYAKVEGRKWRVIKNIAYNVGACILAFLACFLLVNMMLFFRYWGPETVPLYICDTYTYV